MKLNMVHTLADRNEKDVDDIAIYKLKTLYSYHLLVLHHSDNYCLCRVPDTFSRPGVNNEFQQVNSHYFHQIIINFLSVCRVM